MDGWRRGSGQDKAQFRADGWFSVGVGVTNGAAEVLEFPPSAISCSAARGTGPPPCPWQTVFRAARGAGGPLSPWQTVIRAAEGAGASLSPWQTVFRAARGAGASPCPWQPFFRAAGGAGARLCPGRAHYLRLRRFSSARKASALRLWSARVRAKTCVPEKSGLAQK